MRSHAIVSGSTSALRATPEVLDFGAVPAGPAVERKIRIANPTKAPISISRVQTPCGCTLLRGVLGDLGPGCEREFSLQFNPIGKSGFQEYPLTIRATDGTVVLRISGFVRPAEPYSPTALNFGSLGYDATATRHVELRVPNGAPGSCQVIEQTPPIHVSIRERVGSDDVLVANLDVRLPASGIRFGPFSGWVRFKYQDELRQFHTASIPVAATITEIPSGESLRVCKLQQHGSRLRGAITLHELPFRPGYEINALPPDSCLRVIASRAPGAGTLLELETGPREAGVLQVRLEVKERSAQGRGHRFRAILISPKL